MANNEPADHEIVRHHRRMRSHGGDDSKENISLVTYLQHKCFHYLFGNGTPEQIVEKLNRYWLPKNCPAYIKRGFNEKEKGS